MAAIGDEYQVHSASELAGGYDGLEGIVDATYLQAYDTADSFLNELFGRKKGLVKLVVSITGTPSTACTPQLFNPWCGKFRNSRFSSTGRVIVVGPISRGRNRLFSVLTVQFGRTGLPGSCQWSR